MKLGLNRKEIYQTTAPFPVHRANQTTVTDPLNLPEEETALSEARSVRSKVTKGIDTFLDMDMKHTRRN